MSEWLLRETFVGPQSAVAKELFQAAEFRESVFDATSLSLSSRY